MSKLRGLKGEVEAGEAVEEQFLKKARGRAACTMIMHWEEEEGKEAWLLGVAAVKWRKLSKFGEEGRG